MQNGSYGEKEKSRESKAKHAMVKLKETSCQEAFKQEVTRILGGKDGYLMSDPQTAEMLRKTAKTVLGETYGKRKGGKETWWPNEKVQESIKERDKESMG